MSLLREILNTPLDSEHGSPDSGPAVRPPGYRGPIYGPEGRTLPAPWLAEEFPELRGEALPPPLDYLCDDERIMPLLRERWRGRFAGSFAWRAGRAALLALTAACLVMAFWPEARLRTPARVSLVVVWGPLALAFFIEYTRLWSNRSRWRQPRLLLYPTDRHALHEIWMTPLQPRDLMLAQWLRAVAPRPAKPPAGWRPGAPERVDWRMKVMLSSGAAAAVFGAALFMSYRVNITMNRFDVAARVTLLLAWEGGAALWLMTRSFAGASVAWIFPIPPMPPVGEKGQWSLRWWARWLSNQWRDFKRSVARLFAGALILLPFAAIFPLAAFINVITWNSPLFYAAASLTGAALLWLGRTPLVALGQRWARWSARLAVAEFERRAGNLRARQLVLLDANKPLPRPR